jgi:D-amino-acid dehydrogenase
MPTRSVCIIGAGIVGCASALAFARRGWRVTLLDARTDCAGGASFANGAQLSYSYVEPLATPAALRALPGWLLRRDSPTRWHPRVQWAHWRWLASFVRACRQAEVERSTRALLALSFLSRDTLDVWLGELPHLAEDARHARAGKLVVYRDARARATVERQLSMQRALGCVQELVSARKCVALEPALEAALLRELAFGVWTPGEQVIDGARLAQGLARASGATLLLGTRALAFEAGRGTVQALRTDQGRVEADAFVVAAGHESAPLLQALGLRLPIEPIKGYSVTLPVVNDAAAPTASITDHARKMVFARLGDTLRVAGFAELVGADMRLDDARIGALCRAAEACFPGACRVDDPQGWAGLRPATPGSRPLIGPTPWANLWLNTGHGGLGLTLAAGSAALLGELMSGGPASIDPTPYRLNPPRP